MEIFEIYCKIQNRLIFIMRIKTFFLPLGEKKKRNAWTKAPPTREKCAWMRWKDTGCGQLRSSLQHAARHAESHRQGGEQLLCGLKGNGPAVGNPCALVRIPVAQDRPSTGVWMRLQGRGMEPQISQNKWLRNILCKYKVSWTPGFHSWETGGLK